MRKSSLKSSYLYLVLICTILFVSSVSADPLTLAIASVDEYLITLKNNNPKQGELYCETSSGGERHIFDSCESFLELRDKGCFGYTTYEISIELQFKTVCSKIEALSNAQYSTLHYFSLESADWWYVLPATVIPLPGGIYSDESFAIEKQRRDELVSGKELGEISMSEVSKDITHFSSTLELRKDECGEIRNRLEMRAVMFADFDNDNIAELLIEGHRVNTSNTCLLGTGNSLGAAFSILLKKTSLDSPISISSFPNADR